MSTRTQDGTLVLADLSGFTAFLAQTELEHAHDVLAELLHLVIDRLRPQLTVAEVEGDAVFAYAAAGTFPRGEAVLTLIEDTYGAFVGRVESIVRHTTCTCSACRAIPILDLKFIVHHGSYVLQTLTGHGKPLGSDVNLAHRLLKNHVAETSGWSAYVLVSEPAARALTIDTSGMAETVESYADLPPVRTFSFDLRERLAQARRRRNVRVSQAESDLELSVTVPAAPAVVWDWLNDPALRSQWVGLPFAVTYAGGRRGAGTVAHCTHGDKVESIHTILDWQPYDYFTEEIARPKDGRPEALNTIDLEPIAGGTRVRVRYRILVQPRFISVPLFRRTSTDDIRSGLSTLQRLLTENPTLADPAAAARTPEH
jgi:uncharacterized protein YndB with AHSA1/START domain/class 3 adenylate cyclase